ncbi:MAG: transcriptional repressor [Sphingomonadaceae bacterium]|uniref:Fur family transcriptional regulator n=1 Tax=Thermaurantiacus sp. TaxID=2820283 RepID=UPI00298F1C6B|nr:transcriptional repressor [Thermaurantiacus sp.]MCS6985995.1 transcriptional repressor [Sphingomonadaceae bacterium]MDW8414789.1 transcriptional repressor [Thermaurantiacus sp.]
MTHAHPAPGSHELVEAARATLAAGGVQWTELRAQIFAVLVESAHAVSAYDVSEQVSFRMGRRIAANSVYRILDLFVTHNLAKRVESRNAYVANVHPACRHDCIFLVCEACGGIEHLDDDRLGAEMRARAADLGFLAKRPALELIGQCRRCRGL